jgi:predicted N-acetyltransferase YhbS
MKIEIAEFDAQHAPLVEDLAQRAFEAVHQDARPNQNPDFVAYILGASNPAGASRLALAREGGEVLGCLAAIPARFRRRGAQIVRGHQIGYYFVDHAAQGKGVGSELLTELTESLRGEPDDFVYTFPNPRSIGRFDRLGYERVASTPTIVFPTLPSRNGTARNAAGDTWKAEVVDAASAQQVAMTEVAAWGQDAGFVRDAAYFNWRACGPGADTRYRFLVCRAREGEGCFVAVLARHEMMSLPFTILVDILSQDLRRDYPAAVRLAGRLGTSPLVYANTNLGSPSRHGATRLPFGLAVPRFANPRPIELLMLPGEGPVTAAELAEGAVMTADWLGF